METESSTSSALKKPSLRNYVKVLDLGRGVIISTNSKQFVLEYGESGKTYYSSLSSILEHLLTVSIQKKMEGRAAEVKTLLDATKEASTEILDACKRNGWS